MFSRLFLCFFVFSVAIIFFSACKKNIETGASLFYGKWKTSYGDTIIFFRESGKNIIDYDLSRNPVSPVSYKNEFTYRNDKLRIKDGLAGPADFRIFQSFAWIQTGSSFSIQGVEWFPFISSTTTYFTFEKIQ